MDYEIFIRFLLAALWGGLVGAERQYRSKSAGFRTMIMISIGSCFFTISSMNIGGIHNPDRIASNIVTGIGFLGAGVIFRGDNRVNGITTAATIWTVAAVGMGIGAGYYFASACASLLILIVLAILPYCERIIESYNHSKIYSITCTFSEETILQFTKLLQKNKLRYKLTKQIKEGNKLTMIWDVQGNENSHEHFINTVTKIVTIDRFEY